VPTFFAVSSGVAILFKVRHLLLT